MGLTIVAALAYCVFLACVALRRRREQLTAKEKAKVPLIKEPEEQSLYEDYLTRSRGVTPSHFSDSVPAEKVSHSVAELSARR